MKTSYDDEYKAAYLALRTAHINLRDVCKKMELERGCWEPDGRLNQRKYQPLRKHGERLAQQIIEEHGR